MKKIFLLIFMAIFLFSLVNAAEPNSDLGSFKKDTQIQLFQSCDSCTYVNLSSIKSPDGTIQNFEKAMTKNGTSYNYTSPVLSQIGEYSYSVCGDKDGTLTCETIGFEITGSGLRNTIGFWAIILILSLGIIVLGYYIEDVWVVMFGSFGLVLFGLYVLFFGIVGLKDTVYTWGIGIITLMLGGYFGIRAGLEQID